jgi:hypothetical protein
VRRYVVNAGALPGVAILWLGAGSGGGIDEFQPRLDTAWDVGAGCAGGGGGAVAIEALLDDCALSVADSSDADDDSIGNTAASDSNSVDSCSFVLDITCDESTGRGSCLGRFISGIAVALEDGATRAASSASPLEHGSADMLPL